jgi:ABC-type multidrug transport system ATPase subunit
MPSSDGTGPPLLVATGLRRSYGRLRVLRDLDLTVTAGEAVAVVGPNGAGKTTLLRLLAGLMRPDRGEIRVEGHPLRRDAPAVRRAVGLVSHQSLLYDDLTLVENLTFAARLYGIPRPAGAARAALVLLQAH